MCELRIVKSTNLFGLIRKSKIRKLTNWQIWHQLTTLRRKGTAKRKQLYHKIVPKELCPKKVQKNAPCTRICLVQIITIEFYAFICSEDVRICRSFKSAKRNRFNKPETRKIRFGSAQICKLSHLKVRQSNKFVISQLWGVANYENYLQTAHRSMFLVFT